MKENSYFFIASIRMLYIFFLFKKYQIFKCNIFLLFFFSTNRTYHVIFHLLIPFNYYYFFKLFAWESNSILIIILFIVMEPNFDFFFIYNIKISLNFI